MMCIWNAYTYVDTVKTTLLVILTGKLLKSTQISRDTVGTKFV